MKKGSGGTWADSGLSQTTASGSFSYTGMSGDATYYFATVAQDNLLVQSATPTGNGSGSTIYDTTRAHRGDRHRAGIHRSFADFLDVQRRGRFGQRIAEG